MKILSVAAFITLLSLPLPANAYIDPGSGSAIISAMIGLFVAVGLIIKTYWYKLKSLFGGKSREQEIDTTHKSDDEN